MNSRIGINKFMNMGKEAKFVIFAGAALLTAMLLPLIEVYWWGVTLSVSAVVAMLMALYRVRLWVRLLTMPFVLIGVIAATTCAYVVIRGGDTGSADADVDATIFSSRLLARCPLVGSFTQTEEGREAKALFERDGDRLDDMRILPWRSYPDRHRRREVLARLGAEFGIIVPLAILGLHIGLAVLGASGNLRRASIGRLPGGFSPYSSSRGSVRCWVSACRIRMVASRFPCLITFLLSTRCRNFCLRRLFSSVCLRQRYDPDGIAKQDVRIRR